MNEKAGWLGTSPASPQGGNAGGSQGSSPGTRVCHVILREPQRLKDLGVPLERRYSGARFFREHYSRQNDKSLATSEANKVTPAAYPVTLFQAGFEGPLRNSLPTNKLGKTPTGMENRNVTRNVISGEVGQN